MRKIRKVAVEKSRGKETRQSEDLERRAVLDEALEETEHYIGAATSSALETNVVPDENDDESNWFEVHSRVN
jgi:hypothetical protein